MSSTVTASSATFFLVTGTETDTSVGLAAHNYARSRYGSHAALVADMKVLNPTVDWTRPLSGLVLKIPLAAQR
jgi:hypothetical protein